MEEWTEPGNGEDKDKDGGPGNMAVAEGSTDIEGTPKSLVEHLRTTNGSSASMQNGSSGMEDEPAMDVD